MSNRDLRDCNGCGAHPGERHRQWDDIARCRSTGWQLIQCPGERHEYNGLSYGEHEGPCGPDTWRGEYPGVLECRKLGLYQPGTDMEDLNALMVMAARGELVWDREAEEWKPAKA